MSAKLGKKETETKDGIDIELIMHILLISNRIVVCGLSIFPKNSTPPEIVYTFSLALGWSLQPV